MKQKPTKRSSSNKQQQDNASSQSRTRRLSNSSFDARTRASYQANSVTANGCSDSNTSSCKASLLFKNQKALKRDLLRCSDQRPSVVGPQTLHTPRVRHESQQPQPSTSSLLPVKQPQRRRSLSAEPPLRHTTNDRMGPWPDLTTSRVASAGTDFLNPIKAGRTLKNPRALSPKYCGTLGDSVGKFQYHTSPQAYIDEYRKQKGYHRGGRVSPKVLSRALPAELSDVEQLSTIDIANEGDDPDTETTVEPTTASVSERLTASTTDISSRQNLLMKSMQSFLDQANVPPSIPTLTKAFSEPHHASNLSAITFRNGHLRSIRPPHPHRHHRQHQQQHQQQHFLTQHFPQQQQQTFVLPPLNTSSFQYVNGMNSADRIYAHSKKPSIQNQSKFFLLEGRSTKSHLSKTKTPQRINSDREVAAHSQDYSDLRPTGGPVMTTTHRTTALIAYQLPRLPPSIISSQHDLT